MCTVAHAGALAVTLWSWCNGVVNFSRNVPTLRNDCTPPNGHVCEEHVSVCALCLMGNAQAYQRLPSASLNRPKAMSIYQCARVCLVDTIHLSSLNHQD